jgi:serine/threonine protein kinase
MEPGSPPGYDYEYESQMQEPAIIEKDVVPMKVEQKLDQTKGMTKEIPNVEPFNNLERIIQNNEFTQDMELIPDGLKLGESYTAVPYVKANGINKYVAVKIMQIHSRAHLKAVKKEIELLQRYFKADKIHPDLLKFIGVYKMDESVDPNQNMVILVSEALSPDNKDLRKAFNSKYITGDVNNPQLFKFFYKLLEIVQALHSHGIVHADIWAPNIVLDIPSNRLLLVDFGESCVIFDTIPTYLMCREGIRRSHIDYLPPYILDKKEASGIKSLSAEDLKDGDIYALAATMYEMFSPEHKPLINIKNYRDIQKNPETRRLFSSDLKTILKNLHVGVEGERAEFQQFILKLLKHKSERDRIRNTPVNPKLYEGFNLKDLTIEGQDTPQRSTTQQRQFTTSSEAQRRLFLSSQGDDPDEDDEEAFFAGIGALGEDEEEY